MSETRRPLISAEIHSAATRLGNLHPTVQNSTSPGVSWPVHVGVVPRQADCYQDRPAPVSSGLTVFRGMGGVGKTQTAAAHARTAQHDPDTSLVVWITATSREAIVAAYAQAAALVQIATSDTDTTAAASQFVTWLETAQRRWLIVLDDLSDAAAVAGLWPPATETGQTLVTTRHKESWLARTDSSLVDVDVFTAIQSGTYLGAKLAGHADLSEGAAELAEVLGHLPLALAQAVAYLTDRGLTCAAYVSRFLDQRRKLRALVPEASALPDDHQATIDVTWSLSIELANSLEPAGLATPLLRIASLLDPNGIPVAVLTSPPITARLTEISDHVVDPEAAGDALRCLHRLSLVEASADSVTVHALVQRATREGMGAEDLHATSRAVADAIQGMCPTRPSHTPLSSSLRANASALITVALPQLVEPDCHALLFTYGESLGEAGLVAAAYQHYRRLLDAAVPHFGGDAPDVLAARSNMATWRGEAGDAAGALDEFDRLVRDCLRVHGTDSLSTLSSRHHRAIWRFTSGDLGGAVKDLEDLLVDQTRVLGPDAHETLTTRGNLARCSSEAGDFAAAIHTYEQLKPLLVAVLGEDHPDTLGNRHNLASSKVSAGDETGAVADFEALLADQMRVLGPEHPATLTVRNNLAWSRSQAGDKKTATEEFEELLEDLHRILGPVHPNTLMTRNNHAHQRAEAGEVDAALEELVLVLHDCLEVLGPLHPITLSTRQDLACLRGKSGDRLNAVRELEELVHDQQGAIGDHTPFTLNTRFSLATNLIEAGDVAGAVREFGLLAEDQRKVLGDRHPDTLRTRYALAAARAQAGDLKRAIAEFRTLAEDCAEVVGVDDPQTLGIRLNLARLLGATSQFTKVVRVAEPLLRDQVRVFGPEHEDTLETRRLLAAVHYETGDVEGAISQREQELAALSRTLMPTHDRITKLKREIEFLKKKLT
ncbi:tetratricopeptide repeat protein [Lentzea sp. NPDC051838]|uniref:tetratricopeptide repeat protein n=1 Tax=Lentzea sp. NPDC051838 TaxID=3154849 RepID=UPI0034175AF2